MYVGGPGSGKGTQCDFIVRDFGYLHLSSGDLLRDEVKNGTEIGREAEQLMKDGKLVPVEITLKLINKAMRENRGATGYLIDGFPRAVEQAQLFEDKVRYYHSSRLMSKTLELEHRYYICQFDMLYEIGCNFFKRHISTIQAP